MENENKKSSSFTKNVLMVLSSNILSILTGILVGFVIPLIMGVTDYGYYKTFTLYSSYIGIFHFGFIDGIYLYFAGKNYDELNKQKFRTYSRFLMLMQLIVALIVTSIAMVFIGNELSLVLLLVAINVLGTNITSYYEFVSQITMRFKMVSIRGILRSSFTIISVIILFILYKFCNFKISYYIYSSITIIINYILTFWYVFTYRDITFGKSSGIKNEKNNILLFFKLGIPLLISNLIGQLIFVVDQQFVSIFFDIDTYSNYAYAYTMINLITVATSAISVVIYPTLHTLDENKVKQRYSMLNSMLLLFVSACLCGYFVLVPIINTFLPKYNSSLDTFKIILPGVIISSSIQVIKYNCYKKFKMISKYLLLSLAAFIIAIIADTIVYFTFRTTNSISIVSIFVLLLWYILVEICFIKKYSCKWLKNFIFIIVILILFYVTMLISNNWLSLLIYILLYLISVIFIYNKDLIVIKNFILKKD